VSKLQGVVTETMVPWDEAGEILVEDIPTEVEYLIGGGVSAIFVNGHPSEVQKLTAAERSLNLRRVVEAVAGRVPVLAGIEAESTLEACRLAAQAREAGADILVVFPPWAHHSALAGVVGASRACDPTGVHTARHHREIAAAAGGSPIGLNNYSPALPAGYTDEALLRLLEIEQVSVIKQVCLMPEDYRRQRELIVAARPDVSLLAADVGTLVATLLRGADGVLVGPATLAPAHWVKMFELASRGDFPAAQEILDRLRPLLTTITARLSENNHRMRLALKLLGVFSTAFIRPPPWIGEHDEQEVRDALVASGLLDAHVETA
jgi:4-hydroxy-tetrahydrodipicolinate synthase